jgi:ribosomal protein S18 acetylase RimI-like enzyme
MKIRPLFEKDRAKLLSMLIKTRAFTSAEIDVAMELIDIVLKDAIQKDYQIDCIIDDQDLAIGYICHGPTPMAQGTCDLCWIAVDPDFQERGVGSTLLGFLEEGVKARGGRGYLDGPTLRKDPKVLCEEWISRDRENSGLLLSR